MCCKCYNEALKASKRGKRVSAKDPLAKASDQERTVHDLKSRMGNLLLPLRNRIRDAAWHADAWKVLGVIESMCLSLSQSALTAENGEGFHHDPVDLFLAATIFLRPHIHQIKALPRRR